jgi:hypothetical protein
LNLYSYSYYDPGWHEYEPTQSEVLTDLQAERRRIAAASGWRQLVQRAPWPLQTIPGFIATLTIPLTLLALAFGAFADAELASPGSYPQLRVEVTISTGGSALTIGRQAAVFDLTEVWSTGTLVEVTNTSTDQAARLRLSTESLPREVEAELEAYGLLLPGETRSVGLKVTRRSVLYGGEFTGSLVILTEPVP